MTCAWTEFLALLPPWLRPEVDKSGRETLRELRLRLGEGPELVGGTSRFLSRKVNREDLTYVLNGASRYSPWAAASVAEGYLTIPGGHRMGLCGEVVVKDGIVTALRTCTSVCIRVARDFPGLAQKAAGLEGSILILGAPGSGKTTLLRDLIRQRSRKMAVGVVDERGELFPEGTFFAGERTDVLSGCPKPLGLDRLLRTMGPKCIAVDEITSREDCQGLLRAGWCGVSLMATAHAAGKRDLLTRPVYGPLVETHLFDHILTVLPDQRWIEEDEQ